MNAHAALLAPEAEHVAARARRRLDDEARPPLGVGDAQRPHLQQRQAHAEAAAGRSSTGASAGICVPHEAQARREERAKRAGAAAASAAGAVRVQVGDARDAAVGGLPWERPQLAVGADRGAAQPQLAERAARLVRLAGALVVVFVMGFV